MQIKVGSFVQSSLPAPAAQAVTGIGFKPKAVILWTTGGTVDGTFRLGSRVGFGIATGPTEQTSFGNSTEDNVANARATQQPFVASAFGIVSPTVGATALARAKLVSFDADGFSLNWLVNDAAGYIIQYMALGIGVLAKAHTFNIPLQTGLQSITGIGFRPDLVLIAGTAGEAFGSAYFNAALSLGAMDGFGGQGALALLDRYGAGPTDTQRIQVTGSVVATVSSALALVTNAVYSSMDADGYTLNWLNVTHPEPSPMIAIAIQCGGRAKVGAFVKSVAAGPASQPVTGVGFAPEGLFLFSTFAAAGAVGNAQARLGIGATSGPGSECASAAQSANIMTPSSVDAIVKSGQTFMKVNNNTPAIDAECTLTSFDTDGFTLGWGTNDPVATQVLYIALASSVPNGWAYNQIGTAKGGGDTIGVVRGARAYAMSVATAGDQWSIYQVQDLVEGMIYRLSGTYMTGLGNPSTVQAFLELREVLGPRFILADGRNFISGGGALSLTPTQGELRRFHFDFLAPSVPIQLRLGLSSFGGAGEAFVDDWRLQPIWCFTHYEPRLAIDSLPETEISATSIFFGPKAIGLGRVSLLNHDGVMDDALGQLLLFNRQARVLSGGSFADGQEVYRDDFRTEFLGFVKDVEASDERVAFDLEDSRAFLAAQLPARAHSLADNGNMDLNKVGYPRVIFMGEALPVSGQTVPYIRPVRIDRTADGYGVYEIADAAASPGGMSAAAALSAYEAEETAEKRPSAGFPLTAAQATQDLVNGQFTVIDNVKPHRYNAAALIALHSLDFNIGGGPLVRTGDLAEFAKDVAAAETAAWTTAAGVAITWTYDQTLHKFTVSKGAGTLNLLASTGVNKQNSGPAWAALGFKTDTDRTGALTYTSDNADFLSADTDHIVQAVSSGFKDDSAGTYTGAANGLIRRGVDMVRVLLQHYLKLPATQINAASFVAARAGEGNNSCYAYLQHLEPALAILARFEQTLLADIVVDGEGIVHVVPYKTAAAPLRSFADRDYISWSVKRRMADVRTKVRLYYGYDPHLDRWSSVEASSPATKSRYQIEQTLEVYTYLSYTGAALNRANDFLALATASPLVATFSSKGKLVDLKIGDRITLTRARAFGPDGAFEDKVFRVRGLRRNPMTGVSKCTAVEDIAL